MIKLLSESTQAAELANESEWDITRWRTSILLYAAPSVLLSKPKKQAQSGDDEKDGIKESNQMKMLKEIRRRLQLAEKGEWHKLLSSHLEDCPRKTSKTRKGSQRTRDLQNATSRAQQGNIGGACQALVGRGLAPNNHDTVDKSQKHDCDGRHDRRAQGARGRQERSKQNLKQGTRDDNRSG